MSLERTTRETTVVVDVNIGPGEPEVHLDWDALGGIDEPVEPELANHFLTALMRYAGLEGRIEATGDLAHHVIEDAAIVLGRRLAQLAEGEITRFSDRTVPMDDALAFAAIDMGGRPHYHADLDETSPLWDHVLRTIAFESKSTLHVAVVAGHDPHHIVEAALKATGLCIRDALEPTDRIESTKGHERVRS